MKRYTVFVIFLTFVFFELVLSQTTYKSEFQVNSYTLLSQKNPASAIYNNNGFLVVWESNKQPGDGSKYGIWGQKFDIDGNKIEQEFQVNSYTQDDQINADVAIAKSGRSMVVWQSNNQEEGAVGYGIFGQIFDNSLNKVGTEIQVNTFSTDNQINPKVAALDSGKFVVVWESNGQNIPPDSGFYNVYAQVFDSLGNKIGTEFMVNETIPQRHPSGRRDPKVVKYLNGGFAITYSVFSTESIRSDIYLKVYDRHGEVLIPEEKVNSTIISSQWDSDIAMTPTGKMMIIWKTNGMPTGQILDINGNKIGSEFTITDQSSGRLDNITITADDSGNFIVTWDWSADLDGDGRGVFGQRFDGNGNKIGQEFQINSFTQSDQVSPDVSSWGNGDFLVVWQSLDQDGSYNGVYGQLFKAPPVFTPFPTITFAEDNKYMMPVSDYFNYVSDENDPDTSLSWQFGNGAHVSIVSQNDSLTLTPENNWFGSDSFMVIASDPSNASDTSYQRVEVNSENDAPVVSDIPNQTINEGEGFAAINLNDYVQDVDNSDAEISWNFSGNTDLTVNINPATRVAVVSIPNSNWNGSETITFTATDPGGLTDSDNALFTVSAVNDPPVVAAAIQDQTLAEDFGTAQIVDLDNVFNDVDGDPLSYTATSGGNVVPSIDGENVLSLASTANFNGEDTVIVTANDNVNRATASDTFVVTVTAGNDAPVVSNSISDQIFTEDFGSTVVADLDTVFSDLDGDTLSYTATSGGNVVPSIDGENVLSLASTANFNGKDTVIVTANDNVNRATVRDTFVVTITPVNDQPIVSNLPDINFAEDDSSTLDLDGYVTDIDDDTTSLSWSFTVLSAQSIEVGVGDLQVAIDPLTHVATFRASVDSNGVFEVEFVATDTSGASGRDTMTVTIGSENDPPVISTGYPDAVFDEDDTLSIALAEVYPFVNDPDNPDSSLIYSLIDGSEISYWITADSIFMTNTVPNWFGRDTVSLIVSDGELSDTADVYVIVEPVNDAPVITGLPEFVEFSADTSVTISLWDYVDDVETPDSSLGYTFVSSSDSVTWSYDNKTGELKIGANSDFSGLANITVKVNDDSAAVASRVIAVTVNPNAIDLFSNQIPTQYVLDQNYPNPFNPTTHIRFGLPVASNVKVEIFNVVGQRIAILLDSFKPAGYHVINFDASRLSSGLYIYRIHSQGFTQVKKMILMK